MDYYANLMREAVEAIADLLADPHNAKVRRQGVTVIDSLKTAIVVMKENE